MQRFIFRMVYYEDVPLFLNDDEIRSKNNTSPQMCHPTSHPEIVARRGDRIMQMPCGGVVNDYVPFYFSPITAMAYSIHRGNVDLRAPNGTVLRTATMDERVFFVINVSKFLASTTTYYFSNIACNSLAPLPVYDSNLANLEAHIAWELFDELPKVAHIPQIGYEGVTKYFQNRDEPKYHTRSSKRMAEFLVKDSVPLSMVDCIITKTAAMKNTIENMMQTSKRKIPVYVVSGCYF